MAKLRLLEPLIFCGLLGGLGCQSAPPLNEAPTQQVNVEPVQVETQPAQTPVVKKQAAAPVRRAQSKAKSAPVAAPPEQWHEEPKPLPVATKYTLPAESQISVRLIDSLSTETNKAGDTFLASLAEPLVVNGVTLFPRDTSVGGRILSLEEPGRVKGVASIAIELTEIQPSQGSPVALETEPFREIAKGEKKKDAAIIGGGAAIGTAIGAIAGGGKGAAIGALAGAGGTSGYVLATKGKQLKYPSETLMTFKLAEPLTVTR
jgi:hypothetical protein